MTDPVRVRPARARDLEAVSTILVGSFETKFVAAFGKQRDRAERILTRILELEVPRGLPGFYVAELEGQVAGTIALRRYRQPDMPFLSSMGILFEELGLWGGLRAIFCLSLLDQSTRRDEVYVSDVAVAAAARRRGVGRALMQHAEEVGQSWGKRALVLDVSVENEGARRLYRRLGYHETKRTRSLLTRWMLGIGVGVRMRKERGEREGVGTEGIRP